jgi:hypothetical protein
MVQVRTFTFASSWRILYECIGVGYNMKRPSDRQALSRATNKIAKALQGLSTKKRNQILERFLVSSRKSRRMNIIRRRDQAGTVVKKDAVAIKIGYSIQNLIGLIWRKSRVDKVKEFLFVIFLAAIFYPVAQEDDMFVKALCKFLGITKSTAVKRVFKYREKLRARLLPDGKFDSPTIFELVGFSPKNERKLRSDRISQEFIDLIVKHWLARCPTCPDSKGVRTHKVKQPDGPKKLETRNIHYQLDKHKDIISDFIDENPNMKVCKTFIRKMKPWNVVPGRMSTCVCTFCLDFRRMIDAVLKNRKTFEPCRAAKAAMEGTGTKGIVEVCQNCSVVEVARNSLCKGALPRRSEDPAILTGKPMCCGLVSRQSCGNCQMNMIYQGISAAFLSSLSQLS